MKLSRSLIKAFLIFPLNVMGVIPAFLVWCSQPEAMLEDFPFEFKSFRSLAGILLTTLGAVLCWKTVSLFTEVGQGTPAPFDPPRRLVTRGPYFYMRNPMMVGVWLVLFGEALFFGSVPLGAWFFIFFSLCLGVVPIFEEPDLEKRFGEPYREYRLSVPRWIPKFLP